MATSEVKEPQDESVHVLHMPVAILELDPKHYEKLIQIAHKDLRRAYLEFAVEVLNQALESDPKAISTMMTQRFDCNRALTEHPTIQVSEKEGRRTIGVMGLINGLFGVDKDGYGFIAGIWETDQNNGLDRLVGFKLLEDRLEQ